MHWRVPDEVCEPYFLVGPRSTRSYAVTCWGLSPLFPQPVSSWITLRSTGQGQGYFNSIHHLLTELLTNTPSCKKKNRARWPPLPPTSRHTRVDATPAQQSERLPLWASGRGRTPGSELQRRRRETLARLPDLRCLRATHRKMDSPPPVPLKVKAFLLFK